MWQVELLHARDVRRGPELAGRMFTKICGTWIHPRRFLPGRFLPRRARHPDVGSRRWLCECWSTRAVSMARNAAGEGASNKDAIFRTRREAFARAQGPQRINGMESQQRIRVRLVARCNHLAPDGPDTAYTAKELARSMASPKQGDWTGCRRLGRYLAGRRRVKQWFEWQPSQYKLVTYSDVDWAGCRTSRKPTTGGVVTPGKHTIKGWSKIQALVACSSGELRLCATLRARSSG